MICFLLLIEMLIFQMIPIVSFLHHSHLFNKISTEWMSYPMVGERYASEISTELPIVNEQRMNIKPSQTHFNQSISFSIPGQPIPLARHRVARGIMYNPVVKKQKNFAKQCISYLPSEPWNGPLKVKLVFYFERPLHHYRSRKYSTVLKDDRDVWHIKRKDLDNLVKFVLDALNGKAFVDDSQVCVIQSAKLYTDNDPRTEVVISRVTSDDLLQL